MTNWKLVFYEHAFKSPRVEQINVDQKGLPTFSLKYNDGVPFKAVYKSENNGEASIEVKAFSDPYLVSKPGYFDVEHRKVGGGWDLPRFFDPKKLQHWLEEKGIKDIPDFKEIHEKMSIFYDEVKNLKRPNNKN